VPRFETARSLGEVVSIQYLRAFAALSVLITHALQWPLGEINFTLLKTGRLGVEVFFVISGFIMTMIVGDGAFRPERFLSRRALRIVPAYWMATFMVTVLALALPSQFRTTVPTIEGLIKTLLFIPSQDPKAPLLVLGWTLDYEAFFYVVFASLFFLSSGLRTLVLCVLFAALVATGLSLHNPSHMQAFYTSMSLIGFCAGAVVAQLYRQGWLTPHADVRHALIGATLALVAAFYVVPWGGADRVTLPLHLLMTITAVSILLLSLQIEVSGLLPHVATLKYLGDASYSLYLFQLFPIAAAWAIGKQLYDVQQPLAYLGCAALAILLGVGFGLVCHHRIERPFLDVGRRWRRVLLGRGRRPAMASRPRRRAAVPT
jgi:exopolysaccharide production protein ExoZ